MALFKTELRKQEDPRYAESDCGRG
jgi:hypothetical protein